MSIRVKFVEGLACPVFACDVCGGEIRDSGMAMAAWSEGPEEPQRSDSPIAISHLHKGACLDQFEARIGAARLMTDELSEHLAFLVANARIKPEWIEARLRRVNEW